MCIQIEDWRSGKAAKKYQGACPKTVTDLQAEREVRSMPPELLWSGLLHSNEQGPPSTDKLPHKHKINLLQTAAQLKTMSRCALILCFEAGSAFSIEYGADISRR